MSRTYRRKNSHETKWYLRDHIKSKDLYKVNLSDVKHIEGGRYSSYYVTIQYNENSCFAKKAMAKYHSDSGTEDFKDPGPSWFKNLTTIRPERRKAKRELHKFMKNEEYEVDIDSKYYYEYWT